MGENKEVTVFLTSCGRPDLLARTLESFYKFNTYPIKEYIIVDDSADEEVHAKIRELCPEWRCVFNKEGIGQVACIDENYPSITTEYVFHMEDDWEFKLPSFIEKSMKVLDADANILQVWLSWGQDKNHVRIVDDELLVADGVEYKLLAKRTCYGLSWNPGLRRMADYRKVAPFYQYHTILTYPITREFDPRPTTVEWYCGEKYMNMGYRGAILIGEHCSHIGIGRHAIRK